MAEDVVDTEAPQEPEYIAPDPAKNPRNISMEEIAKSVAKQHEVEFAETMPSIDEEGRVSEPPPAAEAAPAEQPPAEGVAPAAGVGVSPPEPAAPLPLEQTPIDPAAKYKVKVEGKEVEVSGSDLIAAGVRTYQKETAADYRLKMASELLKEAEAKVRAAGPAVPVAPPAAQPSGPSDADLAKAIQFGTPEQAEAALKELRGRGAVSPEQIAGFISEQSRAAAKDEFLYQDALKFVESEYSDILSNDYLRRLFYVEENRRRASKEQGGEGDARPYKDLYKSIGDDLRKAFNLTKAAVPAPSAPSTPPAGTAAARAATKASLPPVPKTAASRLAASEAAAQVKTPSEIIAGMAASRGQNRLNNVKGAP